MYINVYKDRPGLAKEQRFVGSCALVFLWWEALQAVGHSLTLAEKSLCSI